jgi:hypothetical protein
MNATEIDKLFDEAVKGAKQKIIDGDKLAPTYLIAGFEDTLAEVDTLNLSQALANRIVALIAVANDAQALIVVAETWFVARPIDAVIPPDLRPSQSADRKPGLFAAQVAQTPDGGRVTRVQIWAIERSAGSVTISDKPLQSHPMLTERLDVLLPKIRPTAEQRAIATEALAALQAGGSSTVH